MAGIDERLLEELIGAVKGGDVAAVQALLAKVAPGAVSAPDVEGDTPLHVACSGAGSGSVDMVAALLAAGADVNALDEGAGFTPLIQAVEADYTGLTAIIHHLVHTAGADVNAPDADGRTPLSHAAGLGQDDTVTLLVRAGGDPTVPDTSCMTPVHHAVVGGQLGVLQHMQEQGWPLDVAATDGRGRNALHHALRTLGNPTSLLQWLLTLAGAQTAVAAANSRGETPYMAAAKAFAKQLQVQTKEAKAAGGGIPLSPQLTIWPDACGRLLLEAGADPAVTDSKGAVADVLASSALDSARRELAEDGASVATATSAADYEHVMAELYPRGPNVPPRPAPGTILPGSAYASDGSLAPLPGTEEGLGVRQRAGGSVGSEEEAEPAPKAVQGWLGVNAATLPLVLVLFVVVWVVLWQGA